MGLKDKLITFDNFDKTEIISEDIKNDTYQRINIFYKTLDKIWIRTPKLKVLYVPNIKESENTLTVAIYPVKDSSKEFYKLINKIDRTIKNKYSIKFKPSIIKHDNNIHRMYLSIPIDKDKKNAKINIYNNYSEKVDITDLSYLSSVAMYIELSYVWYDGKKLGLHWEILQIKHYQNIYFDKCQFSDGETRQQIKSIPPPPPPPIVKRSGIPPPPPLIKNNLNEKKFIPSESELIEMKNKLNKISNN